MNRKARERLFDHRGRTHYLRECTQNLPKSPVTRSKSAEISGDALTITRNGRSTARRLRGSTQNLPGSRETHAWFSGDVSRAFSKISRAFWVISRAFQFADIMVRKLKYNEQKLLKKTDFITWEVDQKNTQADKMRKYHVLKREHFALYNKMAASVRDMAELLKSLPPYDKFRQKTTKDLLGHLYRAGIINTADTLERLSKVSASCFARRRLPVMMKKSGMVERVSQASDFVEQGHVRVGPKLVTDPAFFVTRNQEDMITWCRTSKIRQQVLEYHNVRDDYEFA